MEIMITMNRTAGFRGGVCRESVRLLEVGRVRPGTASTAGTFEASIADPANPVAFPRVRAVD